MENPQPSDSPVIERTDSTPRAHNQQRLAGTIVVTAFTSALIFGVGGYVLGRSFPKNMQASSIQPLTTPTPSALLSTTNPSQTPTRSPFGYSNIAFTESGNEIYLKHTIHLTNDKVTFLNGEERTMTNVYSYDEFFDPREVKNFDVNAHSWTMLIEKGITDFASSEQISISDRLFGFKKVPGTTNFIFVMDWDRSAKERQNSWNSYEEERELFYYDKSSGVGSLHSIATFTRNGNAMTYPKIETFSQDSRYVSLLLFGCWNCGGHQPETFVVDLKTLKFKNIGKVLQFSWGQDGTYQYKDYVVVSCAEPQPGECTQDPNTLPLKTGHF